VIIVRTLRYYYRESYISEQAASFTVLISLHRWQRLIRYAQTENLPIDNNRAKNTIRPIAIGKKKWPYARSECAGNRSAVIQSFLPLQNSTASSHSHELEDTFEKLPIWAMRHIDEFPPIKPSAQISSI
jgi:hypothetical protein